MKLFTEKQKQMLKSKWTEPEEKLPVRQRPILELRFGEFNNCPMLFAISLSPDEKTIFGYFMDDIHSLPYTGYYTIDEIVKDYEISYHEIRVESDEEMFDFVMEFYN